MQRPRPPLIMGTKGAPRGLRAAALWADHLNLYDIGPDTAREAFARFDDVCATLGRDPSTVTRSVLCGVAIGAERAEAERRTKAAASVFGYSSVDAWQRDKGELWAIGTPDQAIVRVREFASAGAELIILQDFLPDDLDHIDLVGSLAREWGG